MSSSPPRKRRRLRSPSPPELKPKIWKKLCDDIINLVIESIDIDNVKDLNNWCIATRNKENLHLVALARRWYDTTIRQRDIITPKGEGGALLLARHLSKTMTDINIDGSILTKLLQVMSGGQEPVVARGIRRLFLYFVWDPIPPLVQPLDNFIPYEKDETLAISLLLPYLENVREVALNGTLYQLVLDILTTSWRRHQIRKLDLRWSVSESRCTPCDQRDPFSENDQLLSITPLNWTNVGALKFLTSLTINQVHPEEGETLATALKELSRLEHLHLSASHHLTFFERHEVNDWENPSVSPLQSFVDLLLSKQVRDLRYGGFPKRLRSLVIINDLGDITVANPEKDNSTRLPQLEYLHVDIRHLAANYIIWGHEFSNELTLDPDLVPDSISIDQQYYYTTLNLINRLELPVLTKLATAWSSFAHPNLGRTLNIPLPCLQEIILLDVMCEALTAWNPEEQLGRLPLTLQLPEIGRMRATDFIMARKIIEETLEVNSAETRLCRTLQHHFNPRLEETEDLGLQRVRIEASRLFDVFGGRNRLFNLQPLRVLVFPDGKYGWDDDSFKKFRRSISKSVLLNYAKKLLRHGLPPKLAVLVIGPHQFWIEHVRRPSPREPFEDLSRGKSFRFLNMHRRMWLLDDALGDRRQRKKIDKALSPRDWDFINEQPLDLPARADEPIPGRNPRNDRLNEEKSRIWDHVEYNNVAYLDGRHYGNQMVFYLDCDIEEESDDETESE